jgi:hypothetical protein
MPLYTVLFYSEYIIHAHALTFEASSSHNCIEQLLNLAQEHGPHSEQARDALFHYSNGKQPFDEIQAFYHVNDLTDLTTEMKIDAISRFRPKLTKFIRDKDPYINIVRSNLIQTELIKEPETM